MKFLKILTSRAAFMVFMLLMEAIFLTGLIRVFHEHFVWIDGLLRLFSVVIVLNIIRVSRHLSSDLMWILIIMLFPVPGTCVYLLLGANLITSQTVWNLVGSTRDAVRYYTQDIGVMREMEERDPALRGQFRYIAGSARFPFYRNTDFEYYPLGEAGYPAMLDELPKAERFIFLEYFIIKQGTMWDGISPSGRGRAGDV